MNGIQFQLKFLAFLVFIFLLQLSQCQDNGQQILSEEIIEQKENSEETQNTQQSEQKIPPSNPLFYFNLIMAIVLVCFAGICSGLTVGYLSINELQLNIKKKQGDEADIKAIAAIEPILQDHHLLLSTLLLSNAVAMEALPIFLNAIVPSYMAVGISTIAVLVFGEIIPQAYCTGPQQLQIAEKMAPMVNCLITCLKIITKPIATMLDKLLGVHGYQRLNRTQIKNIFELHEAKKEQLEEIHGERGVLSKDEIRLITSAIDLRDRNVQESMIPLKKVFMIDLDEPITRSVIEKIMKRCYSNILVYDKERTNIVGTIKTKSLIEYCDTDCSIDLKNNKKLRESILRSAPITVCQDTSLLQMLLIFQNGRKEVALISNQTSKKTNLANQENQQQNLQKGKKPANDFSRYYSSSKVIEKNNNIGMGNDYSIGSHILGIITMKDVFEDLVQLELDDGDKHNNAFYSYMSDLEKSKTAKRKKQKMQEMIELKKSDKKIQDN